MHLRKRSYVSEEGPVPFVKVYLSGRAKIFKIKDVPEVRKILNTLAKDGDVWVAATTSSESTLRKYAILESKSSFSWSQSDKDTPEGVVTQHVGVDKNRGIKIRLAWWSRFGWRFQGAGQDGTLIGMTKKIDRDDVSGAKKWAEESVWKEYNRGRG